jgi:hypothetical protein
MTTIQQMSLFVVLSEAFTEFVEALSGGGRISKSVSEFPSIENVF